MARRLIPSSHLAGHLDGVAALAQRAAERLRTAGVRAGARATAADPTEPFREARQLLAFAAEELDAIERDYTEDATT